MAFNFEDLTKRYKELFSGAQQTLSREIPKIQAQGSKFAQSLNQGGQNLVQRMYPQVEPPKIIPKPLTIPYRLSQMGSSLARGVLSDINTRATVGTPTQQDFYSLMLKKRSPEEEKRYVSARGKMGEETALGFMGGLKNIRGTEPLAVNMVNELRKHRFSLLEKANKAPTDQLKSQFSKAIANVEKNIDDLYKQSGMTTGGLYKSGGDIATSGIKTPVGQSGRNVLESGKTTNPIQPRTGKPVVSTMESLGQGNAQVGQAGIPPGSSSGGSIPPSDKGLIDKLTQALREAKPLRGQQEALYTQARGQKMAKMMSARQNVAGEKGFHAELGALKGELPKVEYEAVRQNFDQPSVDRLFDMVRQHKGLDEWDKITAEGGLAKILGKEGGGVPTRGEIEKLHTVFGKEFTEALLSKRSTFSKLGEVGMQLYNLPRSLMAGAGDLSATLMQNTLFAYRHPVTTAKNFTKQLKMFASEAHFNASQEEIASRPTYQLMKQAKLSLTDVSPIMANREEQFMAPLAEKIPGFGKLIRASGRAYTGFLNRMRADVFDQAVNNFKNTGGDINDPVFLKSLGEFINAGTGRGGLGPLERSAPVLSQALFSARKLAAAVKMVNPVFYIKAHPAVRKEALMTMLSFIGGATAITGLADLAGAEVSKDPTSADFGKIKIGNTRFNMYGPYQQMAVLFARLWKGYGTSSTTGQKFTLGEGYKPVTPVDLIGRFFESKEHPTLSFILSAMRGQNQIGEPFDLPVETLSRFIPMVLADGYDLYKEHGPVGLLGTIPTILGIPAQTYGSQIPNIETTPTGKATVRLKSVSGLAEDVVNTFTGKQASNVPLAQQQSLVAATQAQKQSAYMKEQVKAAFMEGRPEQQGNFVPVTDENGDVKVYNLSDPKDAADYKIYNFEKENGEYDYKGAEWSLNEQRLKRAQDYTGWMTEAAKYSNYLAEYIKQLDPKSKEFLTATNKLEDLLVNVEKYQGYGGFTKGRKKAKPSIKKVTMRKVKPITVKKISIPAPRYRKIKKYTITAKTVTKPKIITPKLDKWTPKAEDKYTRVKA